MGKRIEIKPNDQSWVGKKITKSLWGDGRFMEILCVGDQFIFGRVETGEEITVHRLSDCWELCEEPKKVKLVAPALFLEEYMTEWGVTTELYSFRPILRGCKVIWPAIPNKDGFYEVPED